MRAGRDKTATVTLLTQPPFCIDYRKQGGLFAGSVADCPLDSKSPHTPIKRSGHWLAQIMTLRRALVNPPPLRMQTAVSDDAARHALGKIEKQAGLARLQEHLDYGTRLLLREPWVLDPNTMVKPLYGHLEGAAASDNPPHKPRRPSHSYHSQLLGKLSLVVAVEVAAGNQHTSKHSAPGLWELLDRHAPEHKPPLIRGDARFGDEPVMQETEQRDQRYLFKAAPGEGSRGGRLQPPWASRTAGTRTLVGTEDGL